MQIIPVIDIRNGVAVRAVAGQRHAYQPLMTRLTTSTEPAAVLRALQSEYGCELCYVADLDGIERGKGNRCAIAEMVRTGVQLLLDVGICAKDDVHEWLDIGVSRVVISSESFPQIHQLGSLCKDTEAAEIVFSVDLQAGRLLVADESWQNTSPLEFVEQIIGQGVVNLIVLDLAAVGVGSGIPTLTLCQQIKERWPHVRLISGGGVHSTDCLRLARQAGLDGLLIGSALHDGRLLPSDLRALSTQNPG